MKKLKNSTKNEILIDLYNKLHYYFNNVEKEYDIDISNNTTIDILLDILTEIYEENELYLIEKENEILALNFSQKTKNH